MKLRTVLIYLCILVGLGAWLYFYEVQHTKKQQEVERAATKIVHLQPDNVVAVTLDSGDRGKIVIQKPADSWVLTSPVRTGADQPSVKSLIYAATEAASEKVILEKDVKWEDYGLDKPDFSVTLATPDKKTEIFFGAHNPAKTSYYVRVDDSPKLLLVADTLKNSLNKTLLYLRDKSVVTIAPDDIARLLITRKGVTTELQRTGGDSWTMIHPERLKAKASVVTADLRTISNLSAKDIIDEPKGDSAAYGLGNPEETILLSGKEREQLLLIGKPLDAKGPAQAEPDRYAGIKGNETVYVLDGKTLKSIRTGVEELRDRSVVDFNPSDIRKMSIELDGKEWVALKEKENKWTLEKPEKKQSVDQWAVSGILWDLKDLEWKSASKSHSDELSVEELKEPQLVVSLFPKGDQAPIVLKVVWKDEPASDNEKGPATEAAAPAPERPTPGAKEQSGPSKEQQEATGESKDQNKFPATVRATVEPQEEKGTVFSIDGDFIGRLRQDLKKLLETR
jgi:hypothetical protein